MFVASDSMLIGIPFITTLSLFVCLLACLLFSISLKHTSTFIYHY